MKERQWRVQNGETLSVLSRSCREQFSAPALNTWARMFREDSDPGHTFFVQVLMDNHQRKPLKVNIKDLVELEPLRKIDVIHRFSNK